MITYNTTKKNIDWGDFNIVWGYLTYSDSNKPIKYEKTWEMDNTLITLFTRWGREYVKI